MRGPQLMSGRSPAAMPRVLVVGSQTFPDAFESHIVEALRALGCTTGLFACGIALEWAPRAIRRGVRKVTDAFVREPELLYEARLMRVVRTFEPDLVLVTLGNQLSPKSVRRLRGISPARVVCWCQDQMTSIGRQYLLGSDYDAVFVKDHYLQDLFSRMVKTTPYYYLPEACNPRVHRSVIPTQKDRERWGCEIMIAGTLYYYRQLILRQLREFDVKIWGGRFEWLMMGLPVSRCGPPVFNEDKARAANAARICLNTLHYAEVDGLNARAFEIAGCGGFQVITSVPALAEHFDIGTEIVSFRTVDDLIDLVRHYLARPEEAAAIARRGQIRAHREHTYEHRLAHILGVALGISTAQPERMKDPEARTERGSAAEPAAAAPRYRDASSQR
jgi:spore maturation protein CgeB